ncbi:MAG: MlaD family protein [Gammaproteobacteria bacterium]
MRRDNLNYLQVGLFVLGLGALLLVLLYQITGSTGPTDTYHTFYRNVAGIKYGTAVFYEGYQVGQVEDVTPDRAGGALRYRVDFSVEKGWHIPVDSVAKILSAGLLAAVSIDIADGKSTDVLEPGAEVKGQDQVNIFAALNDIAATFDGLSEGDLRPFLRNLNTRLNELASEYKGLSAEELRPLVRSLKTKVDDPELFGDVKDMAARLNDSSRRLQNMLSDENQAHFSAILRHVDDSSADLRELLKGIEQTRTELNSVLKNLDQMTSENKAPLAASVKDLRATMREVSSHIDNIIYHLEGSAQNMHEFTRQIRENPSLLIGGKPQPEKARP